MDFNGKNFASLQSRDSEKKRGGKRRKKKEKRKIPNETQHRMIRTKRIMIFWAELRRKWIEE